MDNSGYITLTRQSGLMREMSVVANNIANSATTGYRQQGLVFSEYVVGIDHGDSLSMASARAKATSMAQGTLTRTDGLFDVAIEGDGFFLIDTPAGERLTRAGSFSPNAQGDLVTPEGYSVLDAGGAPIFIPPDAHDLNIATDGTLSSNGTPLGQLGLFNPVDPAGLVREDGVKFRSDAGTEPADSATLVQGFLESSNVDPLSQVARMIEVQRAYEMGQSFLDAENDRQQNAIKTFIK